MVKVRDAAAPSHFKQDADARFAGNTARPTVLWLYELKEKSRLSQDTCTALPTGLKPEDMYREPDTAFVPANPPLLFSLSRGVRLGTCVRVIMPLRSLGRQTNPG